MESYNNSILNEVTWVSASAGTGKTTSLVHRVIELLNYKATNIVCITFTKSATKEIKNRIDQELCRVLMLSDEQIYKEINYIPKEKINIFNLRTAINKINYNQDILQVHTIHSFCYRIIKNFALEANLSPNITIFDPIEQNLITDEIINTDLYIAAKYINKPIGQLLRNLQKVIFHASNAQNINHILVEIINQSGNVYKEINSIENIKIRRIISSLIRKIEQNLITDEIINTDLYIAAEYTNKEIGQCLRNLPETIFHPSNAQNINRILVEIINHSGNLEKKISSIENINLRRIILFLISKYELDKKVKNKIDYKDIIEKVKYLLLESEHKDGIKYDLNRSVQHLLIDETQDNSKAQWDIINALYEDSIAQHENDINRSLFICGDIKQSIYSFQGGNYKLFSQNKKDLEEQLPFVGKKVNNLELNKSYRSTENIIKFVNMIFENNYQEYFNNTYTTHIANRNIRGIVEIWPIIDKYKKPSYKKWQVNYIDNISNKNILAEQIASKIKHMISNNHIILSTGKPAQKSDFMVLIRKRSDFVSLLMNKLKLKNIPVLGPENELLKKNIVSADLINFGKFLLQPHNNFLFATALKSSLFMYSEQDLLLLKTCNDYPSMLSKAISKKIFHDIIDIYKYAKNMESLSIFRLYRYITAKCRDNIASRLGNENLDILDNFLSITLKFELENIPSLQKFIHWIDNNDITIKYNKNNNAVRIMTIHSAKGLQSPIVFLTDTNSIPKSDNEYDEYIRLLYVAITRPADELYITGYLDDGGKGSKVIEGSWYGIVSNDDIKTQMKSRTNDDGTIIYYIS